MLIFEEEGVFNCGWCCDYDEEIILKINLGNFCFFLKDNIF